MNQVKQQADACQDTLRISIDAKAKINIGCFSRGGYNRVEVDAADHDFKSEVELVPFGIFLPNSDDLFLYFTPSKVTADFIVDTLEQWWTAVKSDFVEVRTLVIHLDNGPENNSHRTQFIKRIIEFAQKYQLRVRLAYYPPYHSKYNPVERCFGVLENHWNGNLLDTIDTVLNFARTMTWKGKPPTVKLLTKTYQAGVKLTQKAMAALEQKISRLPHLEKWFVDIAPA